MSRLALFIDGGYVKALAEKEFEVWVDFRKLASEVQSAVAARTPDHIDLLRTFYYYCPPYQSNPPTAQEKERTAKIRFFFDALRDIPRFEVREGRLRFKGRDSAGNPIFQQKRIDLMLGLDVARLSGKGQVSHIAMIAGDGDFQPAIEAAKAEGVSVWLFHGPRRAQSNNGRPSFDDEIWKLSDERVEIDRAFMERVRKD